MPDPDRQAEMRLSMRARSAAGAVAILDLVAAIAVGADLWFFGWILLSDSSFRTRVGWWGAVAGGVRFFAAALLASGYRSIRRGLKEGGPGAQGGMLVGATGGLLAGLPPLTALVALQRIGPGTDPHEADPCLAFMVPCPEFLALLALPLAAGNLYVALRHGPGLRAGLTGSFPVLRRPGLDATPDRLDNGG